MGLKFVYRGRGRGLRIAAIAFLAVVGCVASSALMLMVLPTPHTRVHYLIAGTMPTIAGLVAILARTQRERQRVHSVRRGE